jgi:hypothetical protein
MSKPEFDILSLTEDAEAMSVFNACKGLLGPVSYYLVTLTSQMVLLLAVKTKHLVAANLHPTNWS